MIPIWFQRMHFIVIENNRKHSNLQQAIERINELDQKKPTRSRMTNKKKLWTKQWHRKVHNNITTEASEWKWDAQTGTNKIKRKKISVNDRNLREWGCIFYNIEFLHTLNIFHLKAIKGYSLLLALSLSLFFWLMPFFFLSLFNSIIGIIHMWVLRSAEKKLDTTWTWTVSVSVCA